MLLTESNRYLGRIESDEIGYRKVYYFYLASNQILIDYI